MKNLLIALGASISTLSLIICVFALLISIWSDNYVLPLKISATSFLAGIVAIVIEKGVAKIDETTTDKKG